MKAVQKVQVAISYFRSVVELKVWWLWHKKIEIKWTCLVNSKLLHFVNINYDGATKVEESVLTMEAKAGLSKDVFLIELYRFKFIPKWPFLKFTMEMESETRMTW